MKDSRFSEHPFKLGFTFGFACICGAVGATFERSWEVGVLMAGAIITLGILSARVGPIRRGVNRLAHASLGTGR